jgi:uncharacterized protein YwgA
VRDIPLLLLLDESEESGVAEKTLQDKGIKYLAVRPDGLTAKSPGPMLLSGHKRYIGIKQIEKFASEFDPGRADERVRLTLRALNELTIKADMSSFRERLRVQKVVYLLEQFGLQTRWGFSWYIHGPYSPSLAHELFERGSVDFKTQDLGEREKRAITRLREKLNPGEMSASELEAAAAIVYITKASQGSILSEAQLVSRVKREKPHLQESVVRRYVKKLRPYASN